MYAVLRSLPNSSEAGIWRLCDRAAPVQWHQQPTRCSNICFIDSFKLAVHVSSNNFAHLQKHFDCIYSFLEQCTDCAVCYRPVTHIGWNHPMCVTGRQQTAESVHCSKKLYIQSKCSWRWAKLSPATCRASLKESIKQMLLHLVGCWYHCFIRSSFPMEVVLHSGSKWPCGNLQ